MIEFIDNGAIVTAEDVTFTYEAVDNPRDFDKHRENTTKSVWSGTAEYIGDYWVHPYGNHNDLPEVIRDVVQKNYIAPGILKKKTQLLWGKGPKLYKERFEDGVLVRDWIDDTEIMDWFHSWDGEDYLVRQAVDFSHMEGCYTKFIQSKGGRVGTPSFARLEHVPVSSARLASLKGAKDAKATHAIVTDWGFNKMTDLTKFQVYNLFDFTQPFSTKLSLFYSNMYSFCTDYYTVPDLYGSLEWLKRGTAVPLILKALSKNSINLKYHVTSPAYFWEEKKKELEKACMDKGIPYENKYLVDYKQDFLKQIAKVLSGAENTGKFWHSVKYMEIDGHKILEHGWEIKEIKQNIKDFVESQIKISEHANRATAAGVGMHTALTGSGESGRADSGSEQLYALKNYLVTGIDIPEMIVTKALNYAVKANFPSKDLKFGFYHLKPQREQDVTSADRVKNQIEE